MLTFGIYALSSGGHTYSSDEEGMLATTRSIVEHGSPEVQIVAGENDNVTPVRAGRGGKPVGVSGIGQSTVAIPFYLAGAAFARLNPASARDFTERLFIGWTNALVTAAGVVLLFLIAGLLGASRRQSVFLALVYAFGTMAWPHAKTFFSEPLATSLTLAAVYYALRARRSASWRHVALSGFWIATGLLARPSVGLFVPIIALYLLVSFGAWPPRTRQLAALAGSFLAGAAAPLIALGLSNWWRYGSPIDLGYQSIPLKYPMQDGLYGLFLSPGKSIFLYAPVVLVSFACLPRVSRRYRPDVALLVALGITNALFFARFVQWHGDQSWGPRYLMMSLPLFILPVACVLGSVPWRRAVAAAGAAGVLVSSLGVVMYFNEYFAVAEHRLGSQSLPDGPSYWRAMHYKPYWSPIVGTARLLPDVVRNSVHRLDGKDSKLQPFALRDTTNFRYGWYFSPPQVDSWVYWIQPTHEPHKLWCIAPVFAALAVTGGFVLARGTRQPKRSGTVETLEPGSKQIAGNQSSRFVAGETSLG